ncbi:MAG: DUF1559 domain-containing protein [Chthoniobacterales bacterium]
MCADISPPVKKNAFTLIELLLVLGVMAVLSALIAATAWTKFAEVRAIHCFGNLRQWGIALHNYAQDNNGHIPRRGQGVQPVFRINRPEDWFNALPPYLEMDSYYDLFQAGKHPQPGDRSVFVCPEASFPDNNIHFISYGMNMYVSRWDRVTRMRLSELPMLSSLAFMADAPGGYASTVPSAQGYSVQARHQNHANVLFFDGHIKSFSAKYLGCGEREKNHPDIRWNPKIDGDTWTAN